MILRLSLVASLIVAAGILPEAAAAQSPAQSFVYGQKRFRNFCRPPLKYAAGACVRHCPAGYRNDGRYCRLSNQRMH
ncbi:hypothetical protein [Methylobacterium persicinum]|uniref:Uncharacterized protein n=1 Tax=Methylobacterium persicinum TaxID=374426 RepID=A0ABU0HR74_9HYPH|nr:hypothetical protein [Methylobacterium persicinum]MDQ0444826.1 hypothetical protein [Methylobacterium persicinum]GJE38071.1 hypothetical protein KHHGKMAE_2137 [Methylobacterium persicinum]